MQPEDIARRDVAFDPATSTLTVGGRSVAVTCDPGDNAALLRTYLDLVAEQRDVTLDGGVALRRDDVVVLAELLDLDDTHLEAQLREILHLSGREAAELTRRLRRQRVATAALGVGMMAAGIPIGTAASDALRDDGDAGTSTGTVAAVTEAPVDPASPVTVTVPATTPTTQAPPPPVEEPTIVSSLPDPIGDPIPDPVVPAPAPATATAPAPAPTPTTAPAPAPEPEVAVLAEAVEAAPAPVAAVEPEVAVGGTSAPADGTDVGYTVIYERDPNFTPPPGVDIGDSMVIERDTPPAP